MSALHADPGLWQEGLESRVLIVSPTHLVSVLSMIRQMWNENRQNRNAIEIAEAAGRMYDKFCGFVGDMDKLKKELKTSIKPILRRWVNYAKAEATSSAGLRS